MWLTYVCKMNYRICFIVAVLWPVNLIEAARPLTVYYNSIDKEYVLTKPQERSLASNLLSEDDPEPPEVVHCCPAETEEQNKIQEEIDQDVESRFQALFVKQKINPNDPIENVCTFEYKPSARREADNEILVIGYAIHEFLNIQINWPIANRLVGGFIWVFEKQIKYSTMTGSTVRTEHYIFPNQHTDAGLCFNYDLGNNLIGYNKEDFERFYDRNNQNIAFKDVDRPGTEEQYDEDVEIDTSRPISRPHRKHNTRTEIVRKETLQEVVMHSLIPIRDFEEEHLKKETCSYMNSTPIWSRIHAGSLKNVEQYIRWIADKLPTNNSLTNRLRVRTIVRELLVDKSNNVVDLDQENHRYPVYRQLVKIISYLYSPRESNEYENPIKRHLFIAIVIHNELGPPDDTLCTVNVCGELGWHVASTEGGLTYCCLLNERKHRSWLKSERIPDNREPFDLNQILPEGANPAPPIEKVARKNPALIVLYYPREGTYKYADFKELQKLNLECNNESQFPDILLYCPPETTDEKVSASLLKVNMMFVRKIVQMTSDIRNFNICTNHYKPVVWRYSFSDYYIGYLVSEHETSMKTQSLSSPEKWQSEYRGVALFLIRYDVLYVSPIYSEHVLMTRKQTTDSSDWCKNDMQLGLEKLDYVNENTFVNVYNRQNQIDKLNYQYDSSKYYFVKKQLIPIDDFDDDGRKLATCSYMNTYPVWNLVYEALLGVENYLRKILNRSKFIDKFYIHTQLIMKLQLPARPTTPSTKKSNTVNIRNPDPKDVYLDSGRLNIPVPARIMKTIGHRVPLPRTEGEDSNKIEYKYYFMTIMFENSMNYTVDEKCKKVKCIDYGWDVEEWDWPGNRPYCCEPDIIASYGYNLPFTAKKGQYEMLNLNSVVIKFDENDIPTEHEDIAKLVNHVKTGLEQGTD